MKWAHLADCNLAWANFDGADLLGGYLSRSILCEASLCGTNLDGTVLEMADLRWTDLRNTYGVDQQALEITFGNDATALPEGLSRPAHWSFDVETQQAKVEEKLSKRR